MLEQGTQNLLPSSSKRLSEIRILLIGGREFLGREASGKSSIGNIILGRNAFTVGRRTARSVKAEGEVYRRHVTVVDTPGWWWSCSVEDTPKFDRLEIMRSPELCPPGPHVFLLVIPVDMMFPEVYRMTLEEQLEFLSEDVWKHIIVVFSAIAPHDDRSFSDHLIEWPDLKIVLQKCQNRFHVLNLKKKDSRSQVITLMEKIEEMVAQNNQKYFQISKNQPLEDEREKITKDRVKKKIVAMKRQRAERQAHIKAEDQHLTEIQIVLLGGLLGGKSSASNLILGTKNVHHQCQESTECCEVRQAEVYGKMMTVVDTPGWYYIHPLEKTPEIDKLEIRRGVHLCSPGPHAILLTVPIFTPFDKFVRTAVEEHMSLLEKVWSHTIVLFTYGDWLGDTTIEERIEEGGKHLEWLLDQCGWRYHVFNCKHPTDSTQVPELLQKIEEMVMDNGRCYVPDKKSNPSTELELKLKKAEINTMKERRQKDILQELLKERKTSLSEMTIVLLEAEEVGKSTAGNIIIQRSCFEETYEGFKVQKCLMKQGKVEGRQIYLVDTPGWSRSQLENAKEILHSVRVCPHAFLLVLNVNESFTKKSEQSVMELMSLFGERVWRHTLVLFFGFWMKKRPVEQFIECEGEALQNLIRKCGNRYYVLSNDRNNRDQVRNLFKMIEEMVARNRGEYFTLEKREKTASVMQKSTGKVLTEEEWNKREDELIQKMLEAAVVDLVEESKQPSVRRRGSFDGVIPSMSGDSVSDSASSVGGGTLNSAVKVSRWLFNPKNRAPSSGYDTMSSITSSSQYSKN